MAPRISPTNPLLDRFESLENPRTSYLMEHRLLDIIGLTICAAVCGATSFVSQPATSQRQVVK